MGNVMTRLIEANTTIPTRKSETFSTAADNQPSVEIHVLQGERPMAKDNRSLGRFHLDGIMPSPRGIPQIEVTFDIDANGILSVSAKDKATNKENKIRIEGGSQLSKEEIEKMRRDAEEYAEADQIEREKVEKLNKADSLMFQTEKQMKEFSDRISEEDKTVLNEKLEQLKKTYLDKNIDLIDQHCDELNEVWQRISTKLYGQAQADVQEIKPEDMSPNVGDGPENVQFEEVVE
jgi:molecular chaperone DnaK